MLIEMGASTGEFWAPEVYVHIALDGTPSGNLKAGNGLSLTVENGGPDTLLKLIGYLDVARDAALKKLRSIDVPDIPDELEQAGGSRPWK